GHPCSTGRLPSAGSTCPTSHGSPLSPSSRPAIAYATWRALRRGGDYVPFIGAMGLFAMCYLGLGISLFPYIVPYVLTLWEAAAVPSSQMFMLIGTLFLLPIVFMYTGWSYYVFRGKVRGDIAYH